MAIYNGKHCVFEQVGVDSDALVWNLASNVDSDNSINNWNISNMRNTHLPARLLLLSNALQENLSNTTIQTATNGTNGTLVSTSDKLFIAAEKEMTGTRVRSVQQEFDALITWNYWTTHTSSNDRIKYDPTSTAQCYWLRSPDSSYTRNVAFINASGSFLGNNAGITYPVSLCYAF